MDVIDEDIAEVSRLLNLTQRSLPRCFLVQLLADLQQAAAQYQQEQQQEAQQQPQLCARLRQAADHHTPTANLQVHGLHASWEGCHQSQQYVPGCDNVHLLNAATAISKGFAGLGSPKINQDIIRDLRESGLHDLHDNWGLSTEGYRPAGTSVQRLDLDDGMRSGAGQGQGTTGPTGGKPGLGLPCSSMQHAVEQAGQQLPQPLQASSTLALPMPALPVFRKLDTCSWQQTESIVKVYVPLCGVHTELLRSVFKPDSVKVNVNNLNGKNYVYHIASTFRPINPTACLAVASKTKKNILITIKKMNTASMDEKHWESLYRHP